MGARLVQNVDVVEIAPAAGLKPQVFFTLNGVADAHHIHGSSP